MTNKIIIAILIVLVLVTAGNGYYSFTLGRQVDTLNGRLAAYEIEQNARVQAIGDNLSALRARTEIGLTDIGKKLTDTQTDIAAMKSDVASAKDRITGAENTLNAVSSQVTALDKRLAGAEALSNSVINAADVYQKTVKATVRITNGQSSAGSGFIYDKSGRVVTAYHVVDGLTPIFVLMYDGSVSRATILGYCRFSDVAVLKLDSIPAIDPLPLADSGKIRVGDPVIALGSPGDSDNPLGLRDTLTSGIVSQVNRSITINDLFIANLIQFDAAVNFGNSGCALINAASQVVGVVNARVDPIAGDGIYWAIASNKVKRVAESIISKGFFAYPWIGSGIADITPEQARDRSLETANGVIITSVVSGGPAQTAGLIAGDIITAMDEVGMRNTSDLTSYLGEFKSPGDKIVFDVLRGNTKLKITVTVGTRT
jgi:S1-C subfamily serine protease